MEDNEDNVGDAGENVNAGVGGEDNEDNVDAGEDVNAGGGGNSLFVDKLN